jgi:hypothetical protein
VNRDMVSRRVRLMALAAVALGLSMAFGGCLSPTLPVPPPEPLALQEPLAKLLPGGRAIQIEGTDAVRSAFVTLWNDELQQGVIVRADDKGAYQSLLAVDVSCTRPHNHIELWQTDTDGNTSPVKTYRLPNTLGDVPLPRDDAGCPDAGVEDVNTATDSNGGGD